MSVVRKSVGKTQAGQPSDRFTPAKGKVAFQCPICRVYAQQHWSYIERPVRKLINKGGASYFGTVNDDKALATARCLSCDAHSVWWDGKMVFPVTTTAPAPHPKLPPDVCADYDEAASIALKSPRGAAALLRLAIAKLCESILERKMDINDAIGELVKQGLPTGIRKMLDIVRVTGNHAVHGGLMDPKDNPETAGILFRLVNLICEKMIAEPEQIDELYDQLPEGIRDSIDRRDGKAKNTNPAKAALSNDGE